MRPATTASRLGTAAVFLAIGLAAGLPGRAQASDKMEVHAISIADSASKEQYERDVDAVALSSQQQAIAKLSSLLRKYRSTSQEPVLLEKLADLQQQASSIQFRLTYGRAHRKNGQVDLSRFKRTMTAAIQTLNVLIAKYPSYSDISHAYFMRGKGYEEVDNKRAAAKDYVYLVNRFPGADDAIPAYMSLAEFAIAANDYPHAVIYLKEIEKHPDDPHYPFALYKLAWAYYNLKDIPTALHYAETQVRYYDDLDKTSGSGSSGDVATDPGSPMEVTSDNALRENTLLDSTVFYFEGYEETPSKYTPEDAFAYFRGLESGPILGKMYLRYSKLLRSHAHDADLVKWMNLVLNDELSGKHHYANTLDIVLNTYEHIRDRRNWPELTKTAGDIIALYDQAKSSKFGMYKAMPRAQQMLLDTAQSMQAVIVKNKDSDEAKKLSTTLASIYFAFVKVVDEADPRIPGVHYNLAETLFAVQDYDGATTHYRWVVDHGSWRASGKSRLKDQVSVADASLKAIASRYEILEKNGMVPKDITAVSLLKSSDAALPPLLHEWIGWIDELRLHSRKNNDNFVFEANRALYSHGHVVDAVRRLTDFAESNPTSKFAIPSASLVIDTYIASGDWNLLLAKSEELGDIDEWKDTPFSKRLFAVSADASYKLVEEKAHQKDYAGTISGVDRFLKTYAKSDLLGDALTLAGTAAMESHQDGVAMKYFSRLIAAAAKPVAPGAKPIDPKSVKDALLARARIEEARYSLENAANDYRAYLKFEGKPDADLQKKILELTWIDGDWSALKSALAEKTLCDDSTKLECERYLALGTLEKPSLFGSDLDEAFKRARKESGELAGLWAIVSLQHAHDLAFRDRLLAIRHAATHWDDLDPLVKLAVLPYLNDSIPQALAMNRKMMDEVAPLRAPSADSEEKYIAHRVDVMREMENAVTLAMRLPWARIKAGAMNQLAATYIDFSQSLSALQPKGLKANELALYQETVRKITIPFEEKGEDLRGKAFELASEFAIEDPALHAISEPFFADNPSQAKKYRQPAGVASRSGDAAAGIDLNLDFMDIVDTSTRWKKIEANLDSDNSSDDSSDDSSGDSDKATAHATARAFVRSLDKHNWPKMAYILQQAKARSAFSEPVLSAMRAVSMASLGAQAEGLMELNRSRQQWAGKTKIFVLSTLSRYFERSYAFDQAQSLQKEIDAELAPKAAASPTPAGVHQAEAAKSRLSSVD